LEPAEPGVIWQTVDDAGRGLHAEEALGKVLADVGHGGVKIIVRFGDPGHEIARHAEEIAADLVVIPSHGRSGISRILLGSVTERVVRLAHFPVLVLKK
jgi:nucleotide-binding universal stress UspA family protein